MVSEHITLRITREDNEHFADPAQAPVADWRWAELLDCLPEHVEVVETKPTTEQFLALARLMGQRQSNLTLTSEPYGLPDGYLGFHFAADDRLVGGIAPDGSVST